MKKVLLVCVFFILVIKFLSISDSDKVLLTAATNGIVSDVHTALNNGADIDTKNKSKLLFHSLLDSNLTKIHLALDRSKGDTALILAALYSHKDIVQILLDSGADVTAKCEHDSTALMHAAENRDNDIVELLKKYGAKE